MGKPKNTKNVELKALKINHPNSRKALRLRKEVIRDEAIKRTKDHYIIKKNIFGEKLMWFKNNMLQDVNVYTGKMAEELIDKYLGRFKSELDQIDLKHSIGQRKGRQHASREDVIRMTIERETEEFNSAGLEVVDLLNPSQLELLRNWDGDMNQVQKFKIKRYSRSFLQRYCPPKNSRSEQLLSLSTTPLQLVT